MALAPASLLLGNATLTPGKFQLTPARTFAATPTSAYRRPFRPKLGPTVRMLQVACETHQTTCTNVYVPRNAQTGQTDRVNLHLAGLETATGLGRDGKVAYGTSVDS